MIGVAEIERRDRRSLAATRARSAALQPRTDRAAEDIGAGSGVDAGQQRREPAGRCLHVVVDEHDQIAAAAAIPALRATLTPPGTGAATTRAPWRSATAATARRRRR